MKKNYLLPLLLLTGVLLVSACSDDENPLAPFEPEIVSNADAFQFQITGANNVTVTRNYSWTNSTTGATIDHSTARTGGTATLVILDADGTEVYRSAMLASGSGSTAAGTAGAWTVRVIFSDFDGTANFRVEKL